MATLHRDLVLHNVEQLAQDQDIAAVRQPDGTYHVEIRTSSEAVAMSLQVLSLIMSIGERIYTMIDRAHTVSKAEAQVNDLRDKQKAVAEQYWCYRDQGMAHRVAIECTTQISDVARTMNWTKTDVGYCVRIFPKEYFTLNIEQTNGKEVSVVGR